MESALKESLLLFHEKEKEIQEKSILQQAIKDSLEAVEKVIISFIQKKNLDKN